MLTLGDGDVIWWRGEEVRFTVCAEKRDVCAHDW
jgi:hypothetical protein